MKVSISVKTAGKKRSYISDISVDIPETIITLADLLRFIVHENVKDYNAKKVDSDFVKYLTQEDIDIQASTGKVGFGRRFSSKNADINKAIEAALQGFSDGLYRVLIDELEVTKLEDRLIMRENSKIAFIRLTFLSGRMW